MLKSRVSSPLNILLVVDSSPHATAAVELVSHITWPFGTSADVLVLVPECLPQMETLGVQGVLAETVEIARWRDWAVTKILATQVTNQLQAHQMRVETGIDEGQPAEVALACAAGRVVDLIVIGAKGLGTPSKDRLDPAVYQLAMEANCSVLIARPARPVRPLSTILAIDGSPQTWRTVEFLGALSLSNWAKITVTSVTEEKVESFSGKRSIHSYPTSGTLPIVQPAILGAPEMCAAETWVTEVARYLHGYGVQGWELICFGQPANEILRVAKQREAVLIVIGARGQTHPGSFRLGGVAQRVVKEAACSVLVVR